MKKIILTSLIALSASAASAAINPGVQDVLNTAAGNSQQMLDELNDGFYQFGNAYPAMDDLMNDIKNAMGSQANHIGDMQYFGDTVNHLIALDNWEVQSIGALNSGINKLNSGLAALDNKVGEVEKNLSAGIASVAALSSVAVSDVKSGEISVGGGLGHHNGQSAAAVG
ncbi:MAG: hypothetical protein LBL21_02595, partial [Rickettsiales bacterium]|nr:hypothetical protein [Rickettsiales bacterium]